jgi:hypothetical protein
MYYVLARYVLTLTVEDTVKPMVISMAHRKRKQGSGLSTGHLE